MPYKKRRRQSPSKSFLRALEAQRRNVQSSHAHGTDSLELKREIPGYYFCPKRQRYFPIDFEYEKKQSHTKQVVHGLQLQKRSRVALLMGREIAGKSFHFGNYFKLSNKESLNLGNNVHNLELSNNFAVEIRQNMHGVQELFVKNRRDIFSSSQHQFKITVYDGNVRFPTIRIAEDYIAFCCRRDLFVCRTRVSEERRQLNSFPTSMKEINNLAMSQHDNLMVSLAPSRMRKGEIVRLDVNRRIELPCLQSDSLFQAFCDDDKVLMTGCRNGELYSLDFRARKPKQVFRSSSGSITWLRPLNERPWEVLISASTLQRIDRRMPNKVVCRYLGHDAKHYSTNYPDIDSSESWLAACSTEGLVRVYEVWTGRLYECVPLNLNEPYIAKCKCFFDQAELQIYCLSGQQVRLLASS